MRESDLVADGKWYNSNQQLQGRSGPPAQNSQLVGMAIVEVVNEWLVGLGQSHCIRGMFVSEGEYLSSFRASKRLGGLVQSY